MTPSCTGRAAALLLTLGSAALAGPGFPGFPGSAAPTPASTASTAQLRTWAAYQVGHRFGGDIADLVEVSSLEAVIEGLKAGVAGEEMAVPEGEQRFAMQELQKSLFQLAAKKLAAAKEAGMKAEKAYMDANKAKEGVKVTASGLQYEVLVAGQGENPKPTDEVTVHYKGTLLDGTVFDSSYERGRPLSFQLNRVIKGWGEGVQLMKPGAKYRFVIPWQMGYGAQGAGEDIPPYATLIFEVELLSIGKQKPKLQFQLPTGR